MVTAALNDTDLRQRAWDAAAAVVDPEIPVLTIADLGVLRDVTVNDGSVEVAITPTYSGCPAMNMIALEIELALERAGLRQPEGAHRAVAGLDHRLDERRRPQKAQGIRHRAAASGRLRVARCSACSRWRARNAAPGIPNCFPSSARPPARRCGAAGTAANRSTISSVIEDVFATPRFHRLAVDDLRRKSADAVSLTFAIPQALADDYRFAPGQYLTLRTTMDGEEVRRSYSICSGPDDGELRIAVKKVDGGAFSSWAADELKAGDELDVMTPTGRFGVAHTPGEARIYVGFAAGSGITPILSIVKGVLAREPDSQFFLFYGNRSTAASCFARRWKI